MALDLSGEQNGVVKNHPSVTSILQPTTWFHPERLHPQIESLIYWRNTKKSGFVFGIGVSAIFAIACVSIVRIVASVALAFLVGGLLFRLYKHIMQAMQIVPAEHLLDKIFAIDYNISPEKARIFACQAAEQINYFTNSLRRLFVVEDINESLKFGFILWIMTYIGAWFNGLTLILLALIFFFLVPKTYENHKGDFDQILGFCRKKYADGLQKFRKTLMGVQNKDDKIENPIDDIETDKDK